MSEWWGVASRNGRLIVLHHIDSPKLAGARHRLTEAFSAVVASMILNRREPHGTDPPPPTRPQ